MICRLGSPCRVPASIGRALALSLACITLPFGCADDPAAGDAETGETGSSSSAETGDGTGSSDPCEPNPCDDDDPCTADVCDPADTSCTHEPTLTNDCRPTIEVDFPPRGATLQGDAQDPTVTVTGSVRSGLGDITTLTLNGESLSVGADGGFETTIDVGVGGTSLVFETEDSAENKRKRVQSFLWSTGYLEPTTPTEGIAPQALGIWLSQQVIDDGDRSEPINDLASILDVALLNLDLSGVFDPTTPIASEAGFDIYVTDVRIVETELALTAIDGGLHIMANLKDVDGDLRFDCTNFGCELLGGDSSGGLRVRDLIIEADLFLGVAADNSLSVDVQNVSTSLDPDKVSISSNNGWTDFLLSIIEPLILGGVVSDLETTLNDSLSGLLGPLLEEGLGALAFNLNIDLPSLADPDSVIPVELLTDFDSVDFHDGAAPPDPSPPQGGVFGERGGGYTPMLVTPHENLGIPNRDACGAGNQVLDLPRVAPLELGLSDDLLNQLLYAGWRGGLLEFDVGPEILGDVDLSTFGITELQMHASGMLAPTVSDCNVDGELRAHVGDLRIDAVMTINGKEVPFTSFTSLSAKVELSTTEDGLGIGISGVDEVDTELTIFDDSEILGEQLVAGLLESALVDTIETALGGGGLGAIPLPEIDLSASLGLAPGTAVIEIQPMSVDRQSGVTVVGGTL